MGKNLRRVDVTMRSSGRGTSIEVFAEKDPVRAAKRFAKKLGFDIAAFEWANAKVLEGPSPNSPPELDAFEEEVFRGMLTCEI